MRILLQKMPVFEAFWCYMKECLVVKVYIVLNVGSSERKTDIPYAVGILVLPLYHFEMNTVGSLSVRRR